MSKKPSRQDSLHATAEVQPARATKKKQPLPAEKLLHDLQANQAELEMQNEELRQLNIALEKCRDRYVDFYDFAPVGYLTLSHDGMIDEINLTGATLLGVERHKLPYQCFASYVATEDRDRWHRLFLSVLKDSNKLSCELALQHDSRTHIYAQLDCIRLEKDGNEPIVRIALADITERRQAETALRQKRDINQHYLNVMHALMVELDSDGNVTMINRAAQNLLGYTETELLGRNWFETCLPQPDGMEIVYPVFCRLMAGDTSPGNEFENAVLCRDGSRRQIAWRNTCLTDRDGRIVGTLSSGMDITARKHTELALQDSEARYRRFAEELPLGIIITQDGRIKYVNKSAIEMFGYPEEEIMEKPFLPFVDEVDRAWLIDLHQRRMRGEKVESPYVIGVQRGDGTVHQWQLHSSTIEWEGKLAALASIDDITERKLYEQQLRIAATTFESQEGIVVTDAGNVILRVNRAFINITGYSAEEVIGRNASMFSSGLHDAGFYANMWKSINSIGSWEGDIWDRRKNGEIYPAHLIITAVKGDDGALTNYVATYNDITARVSAEEKLLESLRKLEEKERAKTRFLAAAGHDLRQPIAAATLFLEALKFTSQSQQQSELTERIDQSMRIFSSLLDRLLDISKFDAGLIKPQISTFNLADLFNWLEQNFDQHALNMQLRLRLFFPAHKALAVSTDIALVQSVLMNLVSNAIKFTTRGSILVSARLRGNSVLLQVWDTGIGIAEKDIPHIFDEFYQVANPQRNREAGLGLGLSICQRTLSLLGSGISCRSHLGRGSVFEFSLPLSNKQLEAKQLPDIITPDDATDKTLVHGKRVVVVEDDELVAAGLVKLLHGLGAEIRYFPNAEEALRHPDIASAEYFLVDYALGSGLNGIQFLKTVQQKCPTPIRAVIITGETSSQFISSVSNCPWPVLHKPVNFARLASSLNL